jgi:hypothetical protein
MSQPLHSYGDACLYCPDLELEVDLFAASLRHLSVVLLEGANLVLQDLLVELGLVKHTYTYMLSLSDGGPPQPNGLP